MGPRTRRLAHLSQQLRGSPFQRHGGDRQYLGKQRFVTAGATTMNKDTAIAELFFRFRYAKRLLEIDHPTCSCGKPSVGCHSALATATQRVVIARCEEHWQELTSSPLVWRVRWDEMEDAAEISNLEDEPHMN